MSCKAAWKKKKRNRKTKESKEAKKRGKTNYFPAGDDEEGKIRVKRERERKKKLIK